MNIIQNYRHIRLIKSYKKGKEFKRLIGTKNSKGIMELYRNEYTNNNFNNSPM